MSGEGDSERPGRELWRPPAAGSGNAAKPELPRARPLRSPPGEGLGASDHDDARRYLTGAPQDYLSENYARSPDGSGEPPEPDNDPAPWRVSRAPIARVVFPPSPPTPEQRQAAAPQPPAQQLNEPFPVGAFGEPPPPAEETLGQSEVRVDLKTKALGAPDSSAVRERPPAERAPDSFEVARADWDRAFGTARLDHGDNDLEDANSPTKKLGRATRTLFVPDSAGFEIRFGLVVIALFFGGFLGWAAITPLDAEIVAPGVVVTVDARQPVQRGDGGVISAIHVRDGDIVEQGDLLMEFLAADVAASEQAAATRVFDLQIQRQQMIADALGQEALTPPPEWETLSETDRALADQALARHRQRGEGADTLEARIQDYRAQISSLDEQEALQSTSDQQDAQSALADLRRQRDELNALIAEAQEGQAAAQRDIAAQIAESARQLSALREQLERARLRAPAAGVISGLSATTIGAEVGAGQMLMEIVPEGQSLVVEARVPTQEGTILRVGMDADIRILAAHDRALPMMNATVRSLSPDTLVDSATGEKYLAVELEVSPEAFERAMAHVRGEGQALAPGLPAHVVVPTRSTTALQYMFEPLSKAIGRTFRQD